MFAFFDEQTYEVILAYNDIYNNGEEISSKNISQNPEFAYYTRTQEVGTALESNWMSYV